MYQALINTGKKRAAQKERNRVLTEPDDGQEFGIVRELLGNGRVKILCGDNKERMGRIRGSMRHSKHRVLIEKGNLVVISGREGYDEDKVDIIHKYTHDEANLLHISGTLPEVISRAWTQSDNGAATGVNDNYIEFSDL